MTLSEKSQADLKRQRRLLTKQIQNRKRKREREQRIRRTRATSKRQVEPNKDIPCYRDSATDTLYQTGDDVFIEGEAGDQPYYICSISGFCFSRQSDKLLVIIKWYFRPNEVPESVYTLLVQDRFTESAGFDLRKSDVQNRELFRSDVTDSFSVSQLRGHIKIVNLEDFSRVASFKPAPHLFYCVLGYNPQTKRLATTQGEIRVGPSHQVRLPPCQLNVATPDRPECTAEDLVWIPNRINELDLLDYLRAARSLTGFSGVRDGGEESGQLALFKDEPILCAMEHLHSYRYDPHGALQRFAEMPTPECIHDKWTEEDRKGFVRGLRQYGKNFFRIREELLSHKETTELVEYYYIWKKTSSAISTRPLTRRNQNRPSNNNSKKDRISTTRSGEYLSSASEMSGNETDESESRNLMGYCCHHCFTTSSKDWHHAGKSKALLCTECRLHYKKYGEDKPLLESERHTPPPWFTYHQPTSDSDKNSLDVPDSIGRKSPSCSSSCSSSSELKAHGKHDKSQTDYTESTNESSSESIAEDEDIDGHYENAEYCQDDDKRSVFSCSPAVKDCDDCDVNLPSSNLKKFNPSICSAEIKAEPSQRMSTSKVPMPIQDVVIPKPLASISVPIDHSRNTSLASLPAASGAAGSLERNDVGPVPAATPKAHMFSAPPFIKLEGGGGVSGSSGGQLMKNFDGVAVKSCGSFEAGSGSFEARMAESKFSDGLATPTKSLPSPHVLSAFDDSPEKLPFSSLAKNALPKSSKVNSAMLSGGHISNKFTSGLLYSGIPRLSLASISSSPSVSSSIMSHSAGLLQADFANPSSVRIQAAASSAPAAAYPSGKGLVIPTPVGLPTVSQSLLSKEPSPLRQPASKEVALHAAFAHSGIGARQSAALPQLPGSASLAPLPASYSSSLLDFQPRSATPGKSSPTAPTAWRRTGGQPSREDSPGSLSLGPVRPSSLKTDVDPYKVANLNVPIPTPASFIKQEGRDLGAESPPPASNAPSPLPRTVSEEVHRSKNGVFIKNLWRGENTCSRCDFTFRPSPESAFAKQRAEKARRKSDPMKQKDERRDERKDEKPAAGRRTPLQSLKRDHSPHAMLADNKNVLNSPASSLALMNPNRLAYDATPALRQLSEYARPHSLAGAAALDTRPMMGMPMDNVFLQRMYPQGSRERLEYELQRNKHERDLRERDIREMREMEMRNRQKNDLEFLKHMPGAAQLDPNWVAELQRRGCPISLNPAHLAHQAAHQSEILREHERMGAVERLGLSSRQNSDPIPSDRHAAERMERAGVPVQDALLRLQPSGQSSAYTHAHTHTHLHLHDPANSGQPPAPSANMFPSGLYPGVGNPHSQSSHPVSVAIVEPRDSRALSAASHQLHSAHPALHPGHHLFGLTSGNARDHEPFYRELMRANPQYAAESNFVAYHQLQMQAAAHEALQRQIVLERERHLNPQ